MKNLITRLALYQLQPKGQIVDALATKRNRSSEDITCICKLEWWTTVLLIISLLGVTGCLILKVKNLMICKGYLYSNASHLILFVSDIYRHVLIQISNISGDISIYKLIEAFSSNSITLRKNCIWDTLDIDWSQKRY